MRTDFMTACMRYQLEMIRREGGLVCAGSRGQWANGDGKVLPLGSATVSALERHGLLRAMQFTVDRSRDTYVLTEPLGDRGNG